MVESMSGSLALNKVCACFFNLASIWKMFQTLNVPR